MTIILSLLNGSKLYGLDNENSDTDLINIYVKDRKDYYIYNIDKPFRRKIGNYDIQYIDLIAFCKITIKCNPNFFIPLLEGKTLYYDIRGIILLNYSFAFFNYKNIQRSFTGVAKSFIKNNDDYKKADYILKYRDYLLKDVQTPTLKTNYSAIKKMI